MNGQPAPSTSQPPSKGAIAPAIAPAAAQVPTARPRCLAGEGGAQGREAVRQQHRGAKPLQRAGGEEDGEARRRRAQQGGER